MAKFLDLDGLTTFKNCCDSTYAKKADVSTYTLPTASASVLGGVKIGSGLSIDSAGMLSAASTITVDSALSSTSTNPVQNKVINTALAGKLSTSGTAAKATADASGNVITSTYAKLASPTFTGTPTAPTAAAGTSTTQIATTAFVMTAIANALASYAKLSGATFTGAVKAPTITATTSITVPSGTVK